LVSIPSPFCFCHNPDDLGITEYGFDDCEGDVDPWKFLNDMKVKVIKYYMEGKTIFWMPNPNQKVERQALHQSQSGMTIEIDDEQTMRILQSFNIECVEIHSATELSIDVLKLLVPLFNIANKVSGITLLLSLC